MTNGSVDRGDPAVVGLVRGGQLVCSGTVIARRAVLTAAHCVAFGVPGAALFGMDLSAPDHVVAIAEGRTDPRFVVHLDGYAHDVSILVLESDAPVVPARPWLGDGPGAGEGTALRLVGFGRDGRDGTSGLRRQATGERAAGASSSFTLLPGASQPCMGDSGGPAFARLGGDEYVVGVASFGDRDCRRLAVEATVDASILELLPEEDEARADVGSCTAAHHRAPASFGAVLSFLLVTIIATSRRTRLELTR